MSTNGSGNNGTKYMHAIRDGIADAMREDSRVVMAGIDVGRGGGIFGVTAGLHEEFGDRIRDTPISESAIVGLGTGAAMRGLRPIIEIMFMDFLGVCLDQVMNQAAKVHLMTGGSASVPMVIRTQTGTGRSSGAQHSQSLEAIVGHIPGLKVVMPATSSDAKGLMRSAIDDPNPVIYIENRRLYGSRGEDLATGERTPIGKASVLRRGSDVTIVAVSRTVVDALEAAQVLETEGIECDVVNLRSISPLDTDTVIKSVSKSGRLVVTHDAVGLYGIGAEVIARVAEDPSVDFTAPPIRVTGAYTPTPYSPSLEAACLPSTNRIVEAVRSAVSNSAGKS